MATETTIAEKLQALFDLQSIDSQLDEIQTLRGQLPMEINDLEDDIAGLETRLRKLNESIEAMDDEIRNYNASTKEAQALIERYRKQMDEVRNDREYKALNSEIENADLDIKLAHKRIREIERNKEARLAIQGETTAKLEERKANIEVKKKELEGIIVKTEKQEKSLLKKSDKAAKQVDERLLKSYKRIRSNYRNGLAVVPILRNSCGGCFNRIPPQMRLEISLRKKIIACEHCGRIIVDNETAGIEEETANA